MYESSLQINKYLYDTSPLKERDTNKSRLYNLELGIDNWEIQKSV